MTKSRKLPAFQFYPGDWRKDVAVQSLEYHDRGIWFEMLVLMHDSEQRGKLLLNGQAMPSEVIARLLGLDNQIFNQSLTTLLTRGVASRDEDSGAIVCRRMVRDEKLREKRSECGKLGGNPNLLNQKDKQKATTGVKQNSTPSSSSSSSSSNTSTNYSCAEPSSPPKAAVSKIAGTLPLIDKTDYSVTQEFVDEWQGFYPAIDVLQQLKSMKAWLIANPANKKTRSGIVRFIDGWLKREQNKAPRTSGEGYESIGNRSQQRTNGNIAAAQAAIEALAGDASDGFSGSPAGFGEQGDSGALREAPGGAPF